MTRSVTLIGVSLPSDPNRCILHRDGSIRHSILIGLGLPGGFAQLRHGALHDDSRTLSRLIGRPTTPIAETIAAAL
jgi:NAD(P)H dehydrogenase (quinone)